MISVYQVKPHFQNLLRPILVLLRKMHITPNQITVAAILLSMLLGFLLWHCQNYKWAFLAVPVGLLLRMGLNALDGMMASQYDMKSKSGEALNEMGDIVSDACIYIGFWQVAGESQLVLSIFIFMSITNEFSGILAKVLSGQRRYDGPMGKSDRALVIGISCLLLFWWFDDLVIYLKWVLLFCIGLMTLSTFYRIKNAIN